MKIKVYKFQSDTDYYSFVNSLYKSIPYKAIGADVYIENPPQRIFDLIKYFEVKYARVAQ